MARENGSDVDVLRAEVAALRAEIAAFKAPRPIDPDTNIPEDFKKWASLSATEKTQLAADKAYPPEQGLRPWQVQLVYQPDANGEVRPSEFPQTKIHARSEHEARAFYQALCGITGYDQEMCELVATESA